MHVAGVVFHAAESADMLLYMSKPACGVDPRHNTHKAIQRVLSGNVSQPSMV